MMRYQVSTIGGGYDNTVEGQHATIGGGTLNVTTTRYATISGGGSNTASERGATIGGGETNTASGEHATVSGGTSNTSSGEKSAILGGASNTASGSHSSILGGQTNTASGDYSTAYGKNTTANNYGEIAYSPGNTGTGYSTIFLTAQIAEAEIATEYTLSTDGGTGTITLPANGTWAITCTYVIGKQDNTAAVAGGFSQIVRVIGDAVTLATPYATSASGAGPVVFLDNAGTQMWARFLAGTMTGAIKAGAKLEIVKIQ